MLALLASNVALAQPVSSQPPGSNPSPGGFAAVSGLKAAAFRIPTDVQLVRTWRDDEHDLTYSRYQQYVQPQKAAVDGAQLTVVKRGSTIVLVIGGYYESLRVTNRVLVSANQAVAVAAADKKLVRNAAAGDNGASLKHRVQLWLNPANGRLFQQVESGALGESYVHQVDAETGVIIDSWDATEHVDPGEGLGVKGDTKDLTGLTTHLDSDYRLKTSDNRIQTHNAGNTGNLDTPPVMSDGDDKWDGPAQKAGVDAMYYTSLTDDWYSERGFDLVSDCADTAADNLWADAKIHAVVHYGTRYNNAFFDDTDGRFGYGDGDGVNYRAFSAGQDVVSHEVTHRVTECRAPLAYNSWSGALNEAISDIMATTMEWDFNESTATNCRREAGQSACPDWWVGEDVVLSADYAFRNLADPTVFGDPSHWEDRCIPSQWPCSSDNGGVHINSLIPGHAFYLMVNGGRNARCSGHNDPQADCDVVVPAISIDYAAAIMFGAWGLLPNPTPANNAAFNRQFCNVHAATVYEAALLFPGSATHIASADLSWTAVGRGYGPDTTVSGDCQPPNEFVNSPTPPQPPTFAPYVAPRSIVLAPNSTGSLQVMPGNAAHTFAVIGGGAASATYNSGTNAIDISVPSGMASGAYPLLLSETNGSVTAYAGATLIIDTNPPSASVNGVVLAATGQVGTNGAVPLLVTWQAHDADSGIDTSQLQMNSTNSFPSTVVATGSTGATSHVSTTDVTDYFRVVTSDMAGNDATSPVSGPWNLGRAQENAAGVTYKGVWSAMPSPTGFGSTRFTTRLGASVRYAFNGTDIAFVSSKTDTRGKVKVYIDGVFKKKVNLATGTMGARQIVYRLTGLSNAAHVIRVVNVIGGKRIDVDGFLTLSH